MKATVLVFAAFLVQTGTAVAATRYIGASLQEDGRRLVLNRSDGPRLLAPKLENQDGFELPLVSRSGRYAGWLALYPNQGASYSLPLHVSVIDQNGRIKTFAGRFGMVFGWCFTDAEDSVVYRFSFPHGLTPTGFEMRSIADGKLIRQYTLEAVTDQDNDEVLGRIAPPWTKCAQRTAAP